MTDDNALVQAQLTTLVTEMLAPTPEYFLVAVQVRGRVGAMRKVEVLVDGDTGIGIDAVVEFSRAVGAALEEGDIISGAYLLDVGSPGIDFPIKTARQFAKNVGRSLKLDLADGVSYLGMLQAADADSITLLPDAPKGHKKKDPLPEAVQVPLSAIAQAVVQISF